jgi:hypothetical protein
MAAGNLVKGTSSLAASATYDIKPSGTDEWVIHNIYYNNQIKLSMADGTNVVDFDSDTGQGARLGLTTHVSNSYWLRITNTGSSTLLIAYDGMQTA